MNILSRKSFDRALKKLTAEKQEAVRAAARRLPEAFRNLHVHSGLGMRRFGIYFEFRVGLDLRVLFILAAGDAVLLTVGSHDEIRRYVKENS